jgi:hypothetical protein
MGTIARGGAGTITTGGAGTITVSAGGGAPVLNEPYYVVDPATGNDSGPGTLAQPFDTIGKAHSVAVAGDTIYLRAGTYDISSQVTLTRSGSSGNPITLTNYPGETVILDGINNSNTGGHSVIRCEANYWTFTSSGGNQLLQIIRSPGQGLRLEGARTGITVSKLLFQDNVRLDNSGAALQVGGASTNILFLNNDVYSNGKSDTGGGDGIGAYNCTSGSSVVIRGNRCWANNDDGIDCFQSFDVVVDGNWSWGNGYLDDGVTTTSGDGVGLKLGGNGTGGNITCTNNLVWKNDSNGVDQNSDTSATPMTIYNNTAWSNYQNYAFAPAVAHVLRNNISFFRRIDSSNGAGVHATVDDTFNSWNLAVTVSAADFVSTDDSDVFDARQADGSLPVLNFLRLAPGSDLINAGTDVGLPFNGAAPDLGAYETT